MDPVSDGAPKRRSWRELDTVETRSRHHLFQLRPRKPLFEPSAKAVQRIGSHRVKAPVRIKSEGPVPHIPSGLASEARHSSNRPVNKRSHDIAELVSKTTGGPRNH